jgi:hypothetical protein
MVDFLGFQSISKVCGQTKIREQKLKIHPFYLGMQKSGKGCNGHTSSFSYTQGSKEHRSIVRGRKVPFWKNV